MTEYLLYRGKHVVVVVDYEVIDWSMPDEYFRYMDINPDAIKTFYVNERPDQIAPYIYIPPPSEMTPFKVAEALGAAVFIETWPEGQVPVSGGRSTRKTFLEGYSVPAAFSAPDYSVMPPATDHRRTLYWNPAVTTDEQGRARVDFYNNSHGRGLGIVSGGEGGVSGGEGGVRPMSVSAETVTPAGVIGVLAK